MQKSQYATAGVQLSPGICMNVRSHVRVPDSEAGRNDGPKPFEARGEQKSISRHPGTMPAAYAMLLLTVAFVLFGTLVILRVSEKAALSKDVTALETRIADTIRNNSELTVQVMQARDSARIGYEAVQTIGMIAASGVDSVPVTAPDTRPGNSVYGSQTGSSPLPAELGILSGSR